MTPSTPGADPSPLRRAHVEATARLRSAELDVERAERELSQLGLVLSDARDRLAVAKAAADALAQAAEAKTITIHLDGLPLVGERPSGLYIGPIAARRAAHLREKARAQALAATARASEALDRYRAEINRTITTEQGGVEMTVAEILADWHPSFRRKILFRARTVAFERLQAAIGELAHAQAAYDGLHAQCVALASTRLTEQDPSK